MINEELFKKNIIHYPKILMFGSIIHNSEILKKIVMGYPINMDIRNQLMMMSMTYSLIANLVGNKENNLKLKNIAEKFELPRFGFKTIKEFQKAWDDYGQDYWNKMNQANLSTSGIEGDGSPGKS